MPPSSLYWIQKSASISSSAAGNRSRAASPGVRPPLASAVRMPLNSPAPMVPAPTASDLPRNERRLIKLLRGLALFSTSFLKGRFSLLPKSSAVGLLVAFMPVESQRFALRAAREKLRVCYRARRHSRWLIRAKLATRRGEAQKNGAYGIRTRDLLNAIEALYQLS